MLYEQRSLDEFGKGFVRLEFVTGRSAHTLVLELESSRALFQIFNDVLLHMYFIHGDEVCSFVQRYVYGITYLILAVLLLNKPDFKRLKSEDDRLPPVV